MVERIEATLRAIEELHDPAKPIPIAAFCARIRAAMAEGGKAGPTPDAPALPAKYATEETVRQAVIAEVQRLGGPIAAAREWRLDKGNVVGALKGSKSIKTLARKCGWECVAVFERAKA